ncbi:hypothetical protein EYF80_044733 [Liparis tanakae]|uniref:Uncharacterized protein n=1 Tax=Liparis tanakae TaxID=230148 RepID=A0A4Z2FXJ9_9TELE|nr:hypothetical protein EYF80_044733 [Liparis tanakae]
MAVNRDDTQEVELPTAAALPPMRRTDGKGSGGRKKNKQRHQSKKGDDVRTTAKKNHHNTMSRIIMRRDSDGLRYDTPRHFVRPLIDFDAFPCSLAMAYGNNIAFNQAFISIGAIQYDVIAGRPSGDSYRRSTLIWSLDLDTHTDTHVWRGAGARGARQIDMSAKKEI